MYHIAFVHRQAAERLLNNSKTVEMRISKSRHPARLAQVGDWLIFKQSGGEVFAAALLTEVHHFADLTPGDILVLTELFSPSMGISSKHPVWTKKREARYASFLAFETLYPATLSAEETPRSVMLGWKSRPNLSTLVIRKSMPTPQIQAMHPQQIPMWS